MLKNMKIGTRLMLGFGTQQTEKIADICNVIPAKAGIQITCRGNS